MSFDADVLICGAGAAGLTTALQLADTHRILVITKKDLQAGSTTQAQGGVAAVTHKGDSLD
ncbi:MAG: FAD-dependent oxidoreductase, partial [Gammaproteobacteria bacterium]|nr:FAD-dependent oxidoreductase [Gammaproteobacteria bacterium]